uniref:Uncharacterized protein n=1 Tax=Brassica oleracea var. oleracea TaxID=109376 RepID=A0A0D3BQS7_BRAOL
MGARVTRSLGDGKTHMKESCAPWIVDSSQDGAQLDPTKVSPSDEATMVEPEANFGRAGRSDTYLGELNQSDTYLSELDQLSELSDTSLELNELSDTEEGAGSVAGRNGSFSAHGKIHKQFNLGRFYTKFYQAFGDGCLDFTRNQIRLQNYNKMFDSVQKQRNQRKRQNRFDNDEKWARSGDRPFTKAKRSNRDVCDQNELQTYVSLEKMLHKAIHAIRQLKKKGNTNTSPAPKQQNLRTNLFEVRGNDAPWIVDPGQDGAQLDPTKVSPSDEATMVEPEANFGQAGRSDTYLGELVELNQSDTYIS